MIEEDYLLEQHCSTLRIDKKDVEYFSIVEDEIIYVVNKTLYFGRYGTFNNVALSDPKIVYEIKKLKRVDEELVKLILDNNVNNISSKYRFYPFFEDLHEIKKIASNIDKKKDAYLIKFKGFDLYLKYDSSGIIKINDTVVYNVLHKSYKDGKDESMSLFSIYNVEDESLDCSKILEIIITEIEAITKSYQHMSNNRKNNVLELHTELMQKLKDV